MAVLVSIIVPVYNVEGYLPSCLDSLLHQTLENIEILCVNDGSTDHSAAILEKYRKRDARIRIITKYNGGLSSARNAGLDAAQGEYIGFVDADDYVSIGMYQILHTIAQKEQADIVECSVCAHVEGDMDMVQRGALNEYFSSPPFRASPFKFESLKQCRETVWDKLFQRHFLSMHDLRFDEGQAFSEDSLFMAQALTFCRSLVRIDDALYHYRYKRAGSLTEGKNVEAHAERIFRFRQREMRILFSMWREMGMMQNRIIDLLAWLNHAVQHCLPYLPARQRRLYFSESVQLAQTWVDAAPDVPIPTDYRYLLTGQWFRFRLLSSIRHSILHNARLCNMSRRIVVAAFYSKL